MTGQFKRACSYVVALAAVVLAATVPLAAGGATRVPEIDGSSISAGLGLLAAGVLMLRARRSK